METNKRFTILTFPQSYDGKHLSLNIVFMPRNQNPLMPAIEGEPDFKEAPAFADAKLSFVAIIVSELSEWPGTTGAKVNSVPVTLNSSNPVKARRLFEALANQFHFDAKDQSTKNTNPNVNLKLNTAPEPLSFERSVKKYLPHSYRQSFNFVAPRSKNAVTDVSYHCAVRDAKPNPKFVSSSDKINWGQLFACVMRQPQLAEAVGFICRMEFEVDETHFPKGGWLYIDLADDSEYKSQQTQDSDFVKQYAVRIPALEMGKPRSLFGAIQFPVSLSVPKGNYDEILIEAAEYDDGFASIVHAVQPISHNLLLEESDGFHPIKEIGIRLGWDDEQLLIWYIRQLAEDVVGSQQRIDAPIGAFGYKIDVREKSSTLTKTLWQSLNGVSAKAELTVVDPVTGEVISLGDFSDKELNYQVYPSQLDGDASKSFWLPMYFATWSGKSMVLPDEEADDIYQNTKLLENKNNLNKVYTPSLITTELRYGRTYQFRIRLGDMSGGGPHIGLKANQETASQIAECHFKRYVAPSTVRIDGLFNTDNIPFNPKELVIRRPLLGYPAVVFTGKYDDPITLLKQAFLEIGDKEAIGIADPDVDSIEITVELKTLVMDNLMSVSGRESYIKFYTTTRTFPKDSKVFEDALIIPLEYRDCKVLKFGDTADLGDIGVKLAVLDQLKQLVLPTARTIRLTIRPVCKEQFRYYGLEDSNPDLNSRFGRTIQFQLHAEPLCDETDLFSPGYNVRGIYLQPDLPFVFDGNPLSTLLGKSVEKAPNMMQRLAQQLGVQTNNGLTLVSKKGQRVQFGCSQRIRHSLSPDNSTITFASKSDLENHWLCCITLELARDWTWDALEDRSLVIKRSKRFKLDDKITETENIEVGDIEIIKTAPFNALMNPDRSRTTLIFIDAVEPKNELMRPDPDQSETRFPDNIELAYRIEAKFKKPSFDSSGERYELSLDLPILDLPITVPPAQVPKIVSAGIALSPYIKTPDYSETELRRRYLWIEFAEPVHDEKDTYCARVLSYSPDQLISNNNPELLVVSDQPSLPIDPELIRVISNQQTQDDAGLDAMQAMEKSTGVKSGSASDADRFYLLPLPPGLHEESPELFGFFTYEIRVGHYKYKSTKGNPGAHVWTTAQGRFGRSLKVPGIQHPAPTLICTANRDAEKLYVTAPYAIAVHNGKNITAVPPRTEIWALLYAQVKQADNKEYRNILLDDKVLDANVRVEHDKSAILRANYTVQQRNILKRAVKSFRNELDYSTARSLYKLADEENGNKDATKYGTVIWSSSEIDKLLALYGLPLGTPLSVLCVEILPQITNIFEQVSGLNSQAVSEKMRKTFTSTDFPSDGTISEGVAARTMALQSIRPNEDRPLNDQLGNYRILRTSPLKKVPFVCIPKNKKAIN